MTTTKTWKRQSAANNPVLARVRAAMNAPIYRHALEIVNEAGPTNLAPLAEYLGVFFNEEHRARRVSQLLTGVES